MKKNIYSNKTMCANGDGKKPMKKQTNHNSQLFYDSASKYKHNLQSVNALSQNCLLNEK